MAYSILGSSLVWFGGGDIAPYSENLTSWSQDMGLAMSLATITNTVVTPTRTILTASAGPMQVNMTFLNPVEVHLNHSILSTSTYATLLARKLGQAIDTILVPFSHCCIARQFST